MTAVTDPPLPYELFDTTYDEYPHVPRNSDDGLDCAVEGAAEAVRTCIIRSRRMRRSESTHTIRAKCMATIHECHESAFDSEIMNIMIICSRAACSTSVPSRIACIIMPGIVMMPVH